MDDYDREANMKQIICIDNGLEFCSDEFDAFYQKALLDTTQLLVLHNKMNL